MDNPISVSQLNRQARFILEEHFPTVWVSGEVSNLARPRSGHVYFTLKDDRAQVRCAFFRGAASRQRQPINDGDAVLVSGRLSLYEGRGDYQIIVQSVAPAGEGALQLAFAALRKKLETEGLFDPAHKLPLPERVRCLAVVSSSTGAALQDVLTVLKRRDPSIEVLVFPCQVQGTEAAQSIRRALQRALAAPEPDAVLITRGGGSAEDLWSFNDEQLARDIFAATRPVVSAVGHETDFTIADLVADARAPTPSAGAEMLSTDQSATRQRVLELRHRLTRAMTRQLGDQRRHLLTLRQRLRHPSEQIREQQQRLDEREMRLRRAWQVLAGQRQRSVETLSHRLWQAAPHKRLAPARELTERLSARLAEAIQRLMGERRKRVAVLGHNLHTASPLATLERGYSIALDADHRVVRSVAAVQPGQPLSVRVADGTIDARVLGASSDSER